MRPSHYIFNHIPKTGGTSLLALCRHNLADSEISPHVTEDEARASDMRLEKYRLVAGHFSLLAQARFAKSRYSVTLLRDPIRTIVSTYVFWRRASIENPGILKAKQLPFRDFVRYFADSPALIHNRFTYHLAALDRDAPGHPADEQLLLAAAKHNLAAFDFVGISEEFGRSARLLCDELGWKVPEQMPYENRSHSEEELPGIDEETMQALRDCNRLDYELYAYGLSLFRELERRAQNVQTPKRPDWRSAVVERNRFVPFPVPYRPMRKARITEVRAEWISNPHSCLLEIAVRFYPRVRDAELGLGIAISDAAGNPVWGWNTDMGEVKLENEEGCEHEGVAILQFEAPAGNYFVTVALHNLRRLGFHEHWIDRAALFEVTGEGVNSARPCKVNLREFRSKARQRSGETDLGLREDFPADRSDAKVEAKRAHAVDNAGSDGGDFVGA